MVYCIVHHMVHYMVQYMVHHMLHYMVHYMLHCFVHHIVQYLLLLEAEDLVEQRRVRLGRTRDECAVERLAHAAVPMKCM